MTIKYGSRTYKFWQRLMAIYNGIGFLGGMEIEIVCDICGAAVEHKNLVRHYQSFHPDIPVDAGDLEKAA